MTIDVPSNILPSHRLIHIESGDYPLTMDDIRRRENISTGPEPLLYLIQSYGYDIVYPVDRPVGDVVTEGKPALVDGYWMQQWDVRTYTTDEYAQELNQRKITRRSEFEEFFKNELYNGFPYTFNNKTIHVQLRDVDRTNLGSILQRANNLKADGIVDPVIPYRPMENTTEWMTPDEAITLSKAALDQGESVYINRWVFVDAIDAATTFEQIPTLPITLFK